MPYTYKPATGLRHDNHGELLASAIPVATAATGDVKEYRGVIYNERCLTGQPDWLPFANEHSSECAMLTQCFLSGYHLVVDQNTVYKLDRRGERLARRVLQKTKKQNDFKVRIRGRLKDSQLMVQTLEELD